MMKTRSATVASALLIAVCSMAQPEQGKPGPSATLMKFEAQKEDLLACLQKTDSVVTSKSTLPILANVLLEARSGKVVCTARDLQVGMRCETRASVSQAGATTLPGGTLSAMIRELPSARVTVEVNKENVATIRSGASLFKLPGMSEKEFPRIGDFTGPPLFSIPQRALRGMLRRTSLAASRDTLREVLAGVCFSLAGKRLTLAATDGKRLSRDSYEVTAADGSSMTVIVPIRSVQELEKRLEDKGDALIFRSESQIGFKIGTDLLVSSLIEGRFPDYEGIIPKSSAARAVLDREKFAALVRQVSLVTTAESNAAILSFSQENLIITARTPALGEATVATPVKYEGKPLVISFNPAYLGDVLNAMDENEITLELNDAGSAAVIKGTGTFLHVVMPMRLPDEG